MNDVEWLRGLYVKIDLDRFDEIASRYERMEKALETIEHWEVNAPTGLGGKRFGLIEWADEQARKALGKGD